MEWMALEKIRRVSQRERELIEEVLDGQFSSSATYKMVTQLEKSFAQRFGVKYAVAMVNGTATLHMALEAAGVGIGDEVICPPLTMSSTSLAVLQANAVPVFADVDADTFLITAGNIRSKITDKTKAVITVSLYGLSPQMEEIVELAHQNGIVVIEDNAQCFLGKHNGKFAGTFGDMASFSFQSSKHMTSGEGGIIITNDDSYALKLRRYSGLGYAGISINKGRITKDDIQDPGYERHVTLGWNYRMSDLCAAVALGQLERLDELVGIRVQSAKHFIDASYGCKWLSPQKVEEGDVHTYWAFVLKLDINKVSWQKFRKKYMELGGDGIYGAWKLSYQEPAFRYKNFLNREKLPQYSQYSYGNGLCPVAESVQPCLLQFKTNYWDEGQAAEQAGILRQTISFFEKEIILEGKCQ